MRKQSFLLIIFFAVVCWFYKPFLIDGKLPIPSDTIIGLYNPYRDFYATTNPRGIAYKNPLITDPVRQTYPWRVAVIDALKHAVLPLWNPYSGSGTPLLANFQSAPFYPLNLLFFILPMPTAWSFLIIMQTLLAGIFLYFYLRERELDERACLFAACTFAFCGFATAWLEWGTILQTLLWLPMILLAIDRMLRQKRIWLWAVVLLISLLCSFFAGHLQTFTYMALVTILYIPVMGERKVIRRLWLPLLVVFIAFLIVSAIQWLPTLHFINQSGRALDQSDWRISGWFIPWQHLVQFFIPDYFGNPATGNYWGIFNYGEFVGYIGIIPLVFAVAALVTKPKKFPLFFGLIALIALIMATPTIFATIPYRLRIPFFSSAQPTRLLGIIDFCLAVLAGIGIDGYLKDKKWYLLSPAIVVGILALVILMTKLVLPIEITYKLIALHNAALPMAIGGTVFVFFIVSRLINYKHVNLFIFWCLFAITVFDLLRFGQKYNAFTPVSYLFPNTKAIQYIQSHIGDGRVMTTDDRILPPDFSIMYHLQSVDIYDPLYLRYYAAFIAASQRGKPDITPPYGFNRIITPHVFDSRIIDLLGVKYILSFEDLPKPLYKGMFQEGLTKVYENTKAYPRYYFVDSTRSLSKDQDEINAVFDKTIDLHTVAIIDSDPVFTSITKGKIVSISKTPNTTTLVTQTPAPGFLIITNSYYDTWHVSIDGKKAKLYRTDFALQGVFVPKGHHTVELYMSL